MLSFEGSFDRDYMDFIYSLLTRFELPMELRESKTEVVNLSFNPFRCEKSLGVWMSSRSTGVEPILSRSACGPSVSFSLCEATAELAAEEV